MAGTRLRAKLTDELTKRDLRRKGVSVGNGTQFWGRPIVVPFRDSSISIGRRASLISTSPQTALGLNHPVVLRTMALHAELHIGDDVGISGGSICAARRIEIGDRTLLGANTVIVDTDFHPLWPLNRRYEQMPAPRETDAIIIGSDVFIGTGAIILKGTVIGDGAIVGAGAVVKGMVDPASIVAGNPARQVRAQISEERS